MHKEALVPVLFIALSIAFLDPLMVLMPSMLVYGLLTLFFISFAVYALLMWCERALDEREVVHRAFAGRVAYLAGSATLVIGIIYQALVLHTVDPFLILALVVMTVAKYIGRLTAERGS